jgi:hypothetical protein
MKQTMAKKITNLVFFFFISLAATTVDALMDEKAATKDDPSSGIAKGDTVHESTFGNQYKYNLDDPMDRIEYGIDPEAKLNDEINMPVNPSVGIDRSMGEHGGGLITE